MAPTQRQAQDTRVQQLAGKKVPKARVQRYLKSQDSQLRERNKSSLLLKGQKCSAQMQKVLHELRAMQAPHTKLLSKRNVIDAFGVEGQQSLEFLTTKNDCALIVMASHNKKRPNNLILGRTFDRQILDLCELGVLRFKSMTDYGGNIPKKRIGSKPLLLFCGDAWRDHAQLQNLLIDVYRGDVVDTLIISGLDHLITFTLVEHNGQSLLHQRTYFCKFKKNGSSPTPVPYLQACGPDFDFLLRRSQWAQPELYAAARQQPHALRKQAKASKKKNQSTNIFGETLGRLHLEKQDVDHLQGRKSKALRRADKLAKQEEEAALEQELEREKQQLGKELEEQFGFDPNEADTTTSTKRRSKKK